MAPYSDVPVKLAETIYVRTCDRCRVLQADLDAANQLNAEYAAELVRVRRLNAAITGARVTSVNTTNCQE